MKIVIVVLSAVIVVCSMAVASQAAAQNEEQGLGAAAAPAEPAAPATPATPAEPAIPATPAAPSESQAKRQSVADSIANKDEAKVMEELKHILTKADKYQDLKTWATDELFNRAQESNQIPQVTSELEDAEAKNPDDVPLKLAVAEGYMRLRNFGKVVSIYETLLQKDPNNSVIATRLNDYYILAGQYNKAIANLEPIVAANPEDRYHSDILLNAYVQAGLKDKALALFKQRLEKEGNSPGMVATYAQALQNFGMYAEASRQWQKAYELDPQTEFYKQRAEALQ